MIKNIFKKNKNKTRGFTLVELIVVIAIIAVISALSLFNSSKLNSAVLISNTAYEIGLIIRDAQVAGLGAKVMVATDGSGKATTSNQGVYFDSSSTENKKIVFFADLSRDNTYNVGEESQTFTIDNSRAGSITRICMMNGLTCTPVENVTVMFKRPNPEAYFYKSGSDRTGIGHQDSVAINFGFTGTTDCRTITIYKTGAIQIDKSQCI